MKPGRRGGLAFPRPLALLSSYQPPSANFKERLKARVPRKKSDCFLTIIVYLRHHLEPGCYLNRMVRSRLQRLQPLRHCSKLCLRVF